mmetsp:Transcript_5278/g.8945  ORF Transcript_5278/g.8945 Transcript_5278/m.8945 type:complete len:1029 (-) Transcript_5278:226-3312(-)
MPLRLEIKKLLSSRSDRVKSCDLHPDEPWVLSALYNGHLFIWNYNTQTVVKSFEAADQPIRCAKFIVRKQWIVCGSDDMMIRIFNFNTLEKVREFEAHLDYIRYIDVHPTQPYIISSSDDMQIKLWDWEKGWANTQVFEGHAHYVMQVKFNPKDSNTFASASLDKSVKVWSIGSPLPNYSLEGHERGVNCIDYYLGGDKPYLVSGADDKCVKIWDYQTKSCVQTLEGHTSNVSAVCFHPKLPIILSGSEDGTIRIWHGTTNRLETTLNYGLERCWTLAVTPTSNKVAVGYDEGTIVITLGQEMPVVSIDLNGKVLMANNNDIVSCSMRGVSTSGSGDGDAVDFQTKDLGSCEIFPQKIMHNNNGRFVAVCGDGEYIIYTAQALRNKSFGSGLDFCWSSDGTGDYAVRESSSRVRIFKNFKETQVFKPPFSAEGLYGGNLIAIAGNEFVVFYDWVECRLVMRIDVAPLAVYWSTDGEQVVLACEESYFVLSCNQAAIADAFETGTASAEDGVEGAFELLHEIPEKVESGQWVGGCFLYTNASSRLNYYVGGEVMTLSHLDRKMYLMGFVARENRVFLIDKSRVIVSYTLLETVLQYQTAVVRRDFDTANMLLENISEDKYNDIARFLDSQGFKDVALQVARDADLKLDLAIELQQLETALKIMRDDIIPSGMANDVETQARWKQLGDLALSRGNLKLAEQCALSADDFSGLLLMYSSSGNLTGITDLLQSAEKAGRSNIAFLCSLLLGDTKRCIAILSDASRTAEAAFFARTFAPSAVADCVAAWKDDLKQVNPRAAQALANPQEHPDLFQNFGTAIDVEGAVKQLREGKVAPAYAFPEMAGHADLELVAAVEEHGMGVLQNILGPYAGGAKVSLPPQTSSPIAESTEAPVPPVDEAEDLLDLGNEEADNSLGFERQEEDDGAEDLAKAQAEQEAELLRQQQEAELLRQQQEAQEAELRRQQQEASLAAAAEAENLVSTADDDEIQFDDDDENNLEADLDRELAEETGADDLASGDAELGDDDEFEDWS